MSHHKPAKDRNESQDALRHDQNKAEHPDKKHSAKEKQDVKKHR